MLSTVTASRRDALVRLHVTAPSVHGAAGGRAPRAVGRRVRGGGRQRAAEPAGRGLRQRRRRVRAVPALLVRRDAAGGAGSAPHAAAAAARARADAAAAGRLRGAVRGAALGAAAAAAGPAVRPLAVPPALRGAAQLPDVPELLSEDEGRAVEDDDSYLDDVPPPPPVDHDACNEALAKLVQVKMQHANRTITRPDDWLVFDPVQEKLVLKKHAPHLNGSATNGHCNGQMDGKVSLSREQEPIGDNQQPLPPDAQGAVAKRVKRVEADAAPESAAVGVRKRL
ncbi:unnamed protein product [Phytophthora lilii]|uniref:Unnamed protein product n=1 Tax=Phytophthora lilii TaxID=2077276 RepID=A0A9W7CRC8_9STRA|nr:unnamed protein product [Phytophthora lilii]